MAEKDESDQLQRFIFDQADVRGQFVQLRETTQEVMHRGGYPPGVQRLIGEGLAAATLLAATLKYPSALTLQLQSNGPMALLLIQARSDGGLRAMARFNGEVPDGAPLSVQAPEGTLAITIEPDAEPDRYQGIVDVGGGTLAQALERYFLESEQLSTRVWLAAEGNVAAGLLLQRLPGEPGDDEDAWDRAGHLAATVQPEELLQLPPLTLLQRLFHEETIRLFEPLSYRFQCRCSEERVAAMLLSLGEEEIRETLAEEGQVEVRCEFCNALYPFDEVDVEALLTSPIARAPDSQRSH